MSVICRTPQRLSKLANQAEMNVKEDIHGRWRVTRKDTRALAGTFNTEDEVRMFLTKIFNQNVKDLDEGLSIPIRGVSLSGSPPKPGEQLTGLRRAIALVQTGPLTKITAIQTWAQQFENLGGGFAFTKVVRPTQAARVKVNEILTQVKHAALGGQSYQTALHSFAKKVNKYSPEQRRLITLRNEAYTKEELIRPGALLKRGMNQGEINTAEALAKSGLAEDVPLFLRRNALIDDLIKNREIALNEKIPRIQNDILDGILPTEFSAEVDRILASVGTERTIEDWMKTMGVTADEEAVMNLLRRGTAMDPEEFNIPAIFRVATAPSLKSGFKNGRDQFVAERGMTPDLVALSEEGMGIIRQAFKAGSDPVTSHPLTKLFNKPAITVDNFIGSPAAKVAQGIFKKRATRLDSALMTDVEGVVVGSPGAVNHLIEAALAPNQRKALSDLTSGYAAYQPARNALREQYGDTITLYRWDSPVKAEGAHTLRWTTRAFADNFKGSGERTLITKEVDIDDILALIVRGKYHEFIVMESSKVRGLLNPRGFDRQLISSGFDAGGFDADRIVGMQQPIFRQFIDVGIYPGMHNLGGVSKLSSILDSLEGRQVLTRRVLSGHLNPYELHPVFSATKHVRNMVMREHFDESFDAAVKEVRNIAAREAGTREARPDQTRVGKILTNYLHELEGLPHEDFKNLTAMMRKVGQFTGTKIDDRLAERLVNTLVMVSSQATIPFRPALIVRNAVAGPMFVAPVMGGQAYWHGVKAALGAADGGKYSLEAMKESISRAIKAGAIDPNVLPIHASSEIFGVETAMLGANAGPKVSQAMFLWRDAFDMGFSFYRSADDLGRVVAFEAGRFRVNKYVKQYIDKKINLDQFKELAKVKTFNEAVEREFEQLVLGDRFGEAADFIGKSMADKAHQLYGNANHPPGWGGVPGRLFGQFGTFPVQYLNTVLEGVTRGTVKDRIEYATMHSALNMGIVAAGAEIFGADLGGWTTTGALQYTGGPYGDVAMTLIQAMGGSDVERAMALRNLKMMFPTFDHPQSIFVPGSYFVGDWVDAFAEDSFGRFVGEASGVRFLPPGEESWVRKAFEWVP